MNARPISFASAQSNFDARLPPDDSKREAAIDARAEQLKVDMWQDLEHLSDAVSDAAATVGWYRSGQASHPKAVTFLRLLRDGSDDLALAQMLRDAASDYIADTAATAALLEFP